MGIFCSSDDVYEEDVDICIINKSLDDFIVFVDNDNDIKCIDESTKLNIYDIES